MQQHTVSKEAIVEIDFEGSHYPREVRELRPLVFKDADDYCCVLGPDPQEGVFGCGDTPDQALDDWTVHLRERLAAATPDDKVATYIKDVLSADPKRVW